MTQWAAVATPPLPPRFGPRAVASMPVAGRVRRKEQVISNASTRDVRLELDLLEQEEATTQHWSLRFTSEAMERRFQWYHEEMSLPTSRWACTATIAALLLMHGGAVYQLQQVESPSRTQVSIIIATLSLNTIAAIGWAVVWWRARHSATMNGSFQHVLFATALAVILIVLAQPVLTLPLTDPQTLTQLMLFLLMLLSSIATLWNIQFIVFCGLSALSVAALGCWLATSGAEYIQFHWHVVVLFVVSLWGLARSVYRSERNVRHKFLRIRHLLLENLKLAQQNTVMQQQLSSHVDAIGISGIEASSASMVFEGTSIEQSGAYSPTGVLLGESWMENVLKVLHQLKLQLSGQDDMTRELEYVMQTLTSDHDLFRGPQQQLLFRTKTSRRYSPRGGGGGAEEGSEEWLNLIDEQRQQWRRRKSVDFTPPTPTAPCVMKPLRRTTSGFRQTVVKQVDTYIVANQQNMAPSRPARSQKWTAKRLLARATSSADVEVDLLDFASVCLYPLTSVLLTTLEAHDLFVALPIRLEAAAEFALEIESRYQAKNPYHNATHGAFVVWDINYFLRRLQVDVQPLQVLSALIAGAVHDVNHPGLSNAYLVNTNSPLAIKYSDDSVLERMHLAEAFQACTKDNCDVFEGLSKELKRHSRKLIITMVLATDLSGHLKHVNKLKSKRYVAMQSPSTTDLLAEAISNGAPASGKLTTADDLVFQTLIMMADLGHATKSFAYHFAWSKLVTEEFFRQGDVEKQFQMPVSPLCDRDTAKFDKSQVGFLEFVVLPLYSAARDVLPMAFDGILERIHANNTMWKRRAESVEKGLTPPPMAPPPMEVDKALKTQEDTKPRRASGRRVSNVRVMSQLREDEEDDDDTLADTESGASSVDDAATETSAVAEASVATMEPGTA